MIEHMVDTRRVLADFLRFEMARQGIRQADLPFGRATLHRLMNTDSPVDILTTGRLDRAFKWPPGLSQYVLSGNVRGIRACNLAPDVERWLMIELTDDPDPNNGSAEAASR